MSPNPTARPFIVGALLFLVLLGFWPRGARAPQVATSLLASTAAATRTSGAFVAVPGHTVRQARVRR